MARKQRNHAQRCLSPETRAPAGVQWEKVQRAMHWDHVQREFRSVDGMQYTARV